MKQLQGEVVTECLKKFPDAPSLTLARKIYNENIELFTGIETVRSLVRKYRGQSGKKARKVSKDKTHYKQAGDYNPFDSLPEGIRCLEEAEIYEITAKKTLILADAHIPYHNKTALKVALEYGVDQGCGCVLILGDWWDFYQCSSFSKDPRKRSMQNELDDGNEIIETIKQKFGSVIFKLGNHEDRLERYLKVKAPELLDLTVLSFDELIQNVDVVLRKGTVVKIGRLNLVHGHEFGRSIFNPVNPARGVFLRGHESCLVGHYHQSSSHAENTMNHNLVGCWSVGCLCDLRPEYKPINIKWMHGVATVELLEDGNYRVDNRKIIKGKVY